MKMAFSIVRGRHSKNAVEKAAQIIFTVCAFFAVLAVFSITLYMLINGTPALFKVGLKDILFGTVWKPTAKEPSFGILYIILTSIVGTAFSIAIGVPIGVLTAVFLAEAAPKKLAAVVKPAVELLAGVPSVTSVHRRRQSDLRCHCACNYDTAYGNQYQRVRPAGGAFPI